MGRPVLQRFDSNGIVTLCKSCHCHLTTPSQLISRLFQGTSGRAHLYTQVFNLKFFQETVRTMTTGVHTVQDVACLGCGKMIGWKYVRAHMQDQKYKEGKIILEKAFISNYDLKFNKCLDDDNNIVKEEEGRGEYLRKVTNQIEDCECMIMHIK